MDPGCPIGIRSGINKMDFELKPELLFKNEYGYESGSSMVMTGSRPFAFVHLVLLKMAVTCGFFF